MPATVTQFSMVVPDIAKTLGTSQKLVLLSDTVRSSCVVVAMFASNAFYRRIGLRGTIALGLCLQIFPQFLMPLAISSGSLPLLMLFKGMQGCNSIAFPLYISAIVMWVGDGHKGLATAVFNGSFVAGSGVGSWIAGQIVPIFGWQFSFFVTGGLCLLFAVPAVLLIQDRQQATISSNLPRRDLAVRGKVHRMKSTWILIVSLVANTWITQAVTVDLSVYSSWLGYEYEAIGNMMLVVSVVTVLSSAVAGSAADHRASRSPSPLRARCRVQAAGYILSFVAAALLPVIATKGILALCTVSCLMMFGSSWAGGVFWSLPSEVYSDQEVVEGTGFCSSASNVPNPIAPMVIGVLLGSNGLWSLGWSTCAIMAAISLAATLMISSTRISSRRHNVP